MANANQLTTDLAPLGPAGHNILDATDAACLIAEGKLTSEELVSHCVDRVRAREETLHAWAFIDPDIALAQARARDQGECLGPLHGVPVGIKDVLDTADMPTEYGSPIYRGHRPERDSACVAALRARGAVVLGKTTTTEFASPFPIGARNPHDPARSPGVSSSGSAAAVADFGVPLATGTQTGGSVINPASYCGVYGYKASLLGLDRVGIRHIKWSLDTLGLFARSVADLQLMRGAMTGGPTALMTLDDDWRPRVGVVRTHEWPEASSAVAAAIDTAAQALSTAGATVVDVDPPPPFAELRASFNVISRYEAQHVMAYEFAAHRDQLNPWGQMNADADPVAGNDYREATAAADDCRARMAEIFGEVDMILTPSTAGEAPEYVQQIELGPFTALWTLMHGPCINLPIYAGPNEMPIGIQLVGSVGSDDRSLSIAAWIDERLQAQP